MGIETAIAIGVTVAATAVAAQQSHASTVEAHTAEQHQEQAQRALQQQYQAAQEAEQTKQNDLIRAARARQRALSAATLGETRSGTVLTSPSGVGPSTGAAQAFSGTGTLLGGL